MAGYLLELLYPRRCPGCRMPLPAAVKHRDPPGAFVCRACAVEVALLEPPGCRRCGRPLLAEADVCADCPPDPLSWSRSAFLYEGPVRRALMHLKFGGGRSVAADLAPWMVLAVSRSPPPPGVADPWPRPVLTWVPLGRRRKRERGYDQAEALALQVAARAGWRARRLLTRAVETSPQAKRGGADRRAALAGAFRAAGHVPASVILVDDVLTTGATAAACAEALLAGGARHVGVLTAARSLGGRVPGRCYNPAGLSPGSVVARETSSR